MELSCRICSQVFDDSKKLHRHIGFTEKVKIKDYYRKYFPRYDLYSGQLIEFKNAEQYLHDNFSNREHLVIYLQKIPKDKVKQCITDILLSEKKRKNLIYAPSYIEAVSSMLPTPQLCEKIGADFLGLCKEAGLITKYHYNTVPKIEDDSKLYYLVDNREQTPFSLDGQVTKTTLNFGDLSITDERYFSNVFLECKRDMDLVSSLTSGFDRIQKECKRAAESGAYLIFLTNLTLSTALNLEKNRYFSRFTKVKSEYLFHNIRELIREFNNIQFVFTENPESKIEKLFKLGSKVKELDLQYLIQKGLL
jgi:hypothetical protein